VVTPDEKTAVTVSRLPVGDARRDDHAAVLTLMDLEKMEKKGVEAGLLPGTGNVTGLASSPDGRWLYIVHTLGRFTLPTTQLERGWVNSNALTIFDLAECRFYATVLLDHPLRGAADPWGIALAPDGQTAWITLAGIHEAARVDLGSVHAWLAKLTSEQRAAVCEDLTAMHIGNRLMQFKMPSSGPRGVAVSPDGATVAVALYFSGQVALMDVKAPTVRTISLGAQPAESRARMGERLFHDATLAHQNWLSCASCHPDGRADGLNWDLLNDGTGNPKSTKSLLLSHKTPPVMITGIRETAEMAVRSGMKFILFAMRPEEDAAAMDEYLKSMNPAPSPRLVNGQLSESAGRGEKVFRKAGCAQCHPPPLFTDLHPYDVGTGEGLDKGKAFDTPTLIENWRTAPYLYDGRAVTMEDVLTKYNMGDRHGITSNLNKEEIADLAEYILSQ